MHLLFSCYTMPLFLLLISPSALILSVLCFYDTSSGQKQYSNMSPRWLVVVGFLSQSPNSFCILKQVPCSLSALLYSTLQQCCWRGTSPLRDSWNSYLGSQLSAILFISSNSLDDACQKPFNLEGVDFNVDSLDVINLRSVKVSFYSKI